MIREEVRADHEVASGVSEERLPRTKCNTDEGPGKPPVYADPRPPEPFAKGTQLAKFMWTANSGLKRVYFCLVMSFLGYMMRLVCGARKERCVSERQCSLRLDAFDAQTGLASVPMICVADGEKRVDAPDSLISPFVLLFFTW